MQPDSDDDAWRAIVENYGDRARLDPEDPAREELDERGREDDSAWDDEDDAVDSADSADLDDDAFVPPPPPPLPYVAPKRLAAWVGIFGSPTVLLTSLLLGISLPVWLGYVLVAAFVGGFVYLVAMMPRGPRDPFDDGARL